VSLRKRLVLGAAYLLIVMAITLAIPLGLNIERRASSEYESGVLSNAAIMAARISDIVARPHRALKQPSVLAPLTRIVKATERATGARVVATDGRGRIVADSADLATFGTDYATPERPEFSVALFKGRIDARRRFSSSLGNELLLVTVPVVDKGRVVGAVRLSQSTGAVSDRVRRSWIGIALIAAVLVVIAIGVAWFLATSLVRPVRRLEGAAKRLGEGDLEARAEPEGPPEVATLARSFNQMADALAANLVAQQDFVANASHQLRTPLTGLRLRLETIREQGGPAAEQAGKAEREVDRLSALVDDLLELARALSMESTGTSVDLAHAAHQAVERWRAPALEQGKELRLQEGEVREAAVVWADPADVAHIIDNLIENAIRYCPPETEISVSVGSSGERPFLTVADNGPGISQEDAGRVFERFYRGATGRAGGPGTGLGLAIVAELSRRWGGDIHLLDAPGTRIEVTFRAPSTVSLPSR
jgi:signal transduction histidine kinase